MENIGQRFCQNTDLKKKKIQLQLTRKDILVSIECGELFAVVAAEGVPSVALVGTEPQPVAVAFGLQAEAAVFCVHLLPRPVLQLDHQLVVALFSQAVDVIQSEPVFAIYVPKPSL